MSVARTGEAVENLLLPAAGPRRKFEHRAFVERTALISCAVKISLGIEDHARRWEISVSAAIGMQNGLSPAATTTGR